MTDPLHDQTGSSPPEATAPLPAYQPLVAVFLALAGGIMFQRTFEIDWRIYLPVAVFSLALAAWLNRSAARVDEEPGRRIAANNVAATLALLIAISAAGAFWSHGRWHWYGQQEISRFASDSPAPVALEGIVCTEPRSIAAEDPGSLRAIPVSERTGFPIRVQSIRSGRLWQPASGTARMEIGGDASSIRSGDRIRVFGTLSAIEPPTNPGQFDFADFYRSRGRLAVIRSRSPDAVEIVQHASVFNPYHWRSALRHRLNATIWNHLSEQQAGFASAIMLGNREQMTSDRREAFIMTGTAHLLAISGLHVGILAGFFLLLNRFNLLRRHFALIATMLFVLFYAWLVEFRPPVTRAAILIVLFCMARLIGRQRAAVNWLALAGVLVLIINPADLFQVGPQLSFLAVLTIVFSVRWIYVSKKLDPVQQLIANTRSPVSRMFSRSRDGIRAAFLVSGLVWLVAMPLVAHRFNITAPVALLINPLLLIPFAFALYAGLGTLLLGFVSPGLAGICGSICEWNLSFVESAIALSSRTGGGHFRTDGPETIPLVIYYVGLFLLAVWPQTRVSGRRILQFIFWWTVLGWMLPSAVSHLQPRTTERPLDVVFVDVGHGSCVLLKLPDGRNLLFDAGSIGSPDYACNNVSSVLWQENISHLDAVIVSHADVDHFNAIPELMERFSVGCLIVSKVLDRDAAAVRVLMDAAVEYGVEIRTVAEGDCPDAGDGVSMSVLSPPESGTGGEDNSNSIVLSVCSNGHSLLLTGDLEQEGLFRLLKKTPEDFDCIMAPHHGSPNSHPDLIRDWSRPESVIISAAENKLQQDAIDKYAAQGVNVYSTGTHGAIRLRFSERLEISNWHNSRWQHQIQPIGNRDPVPAFPIGD